MTMMSLEQALQVIESAAQQGQLSDGIMRRLIDLTESITNKNPDLKIIKQLLIRFNESQIIKFPLNQRGSVDLLRRFMYEDDHILAVIYSSKRTYILWKRSELLYILKICDRSFILQMTMVEAKNFISYDRDMHSLFIEIDKILPVKRISRPTRSSLDKYAILAINNFYTYVTSR